MTRKYIVRQDKVNFYGVFFLFDLFLVTGVDSEFRFNYFLVIMVLTKQRRVSASSLILLTTVLFIVCAFCEQNFLVCMYIPLVITTC